VNSFQREGRGQVPAYRSLVKDAIIEAGENSVDLGLQAHRKMKTRLGFTVEGTSSQVVKDFFVELMSLAGSKEPLVQTGGIYGVSNQFHDINGALIMDEVLNSPMFNALSENDKKRATEIYDFVFSNRELRNRNPLHPGVIDSCIIGNVLNFPKHIFGLPFGCFESDGNEAMSCILYSYRQERKRADPAVLLVGDVGDSFADVKACVERLTMELITVSDTPAGMAKEVAQLDRVVCIVANFESPSLGAIAAWAHTNGVGVHLHVSDAQWRKIFTSNSAPVHFQLPDGVRSLSLEDGMLRGAYSFYRDHVLRDLHVDVPYGWQTVYLSPNEGGSAAGRPMFMDFCMFQLGWAALAQIAACEAPTDRKSQEWRPNLLTSKGPVISKAMQYDKVVDWAKKCTASRDELEIEFITFQQEFIGGKKGKVEAMTSSGGTRSINLAFESVLRRDKAKNVKRHLKVLTGNPHLAVERAERRFVFTVVRVVDNGKLDVELLKQHISDPDLGAVYAQTLSFTDGISDPLSEILQVLEEENKRPLRKDLPVVLINDACLAFNVLVHNDGKKYKPSMRLLDIADGCITPVIVMQDGHKHLGVDKGLSTITGTNGILSYLKGHRRVGFQPQKADLVRALADVKLMGKEGYDKLYNNFNEAIEKLVRGIEAAGMRLIHRDNRIVGSTVIAVEDPSGAMAMKLKKLGYSTAAIFQVAPQDSSRCQTGWQLSLTPHHLRTLPNGRVALDAFLEDLIAVHKMVGSNQALQTTWKFFREDSMVAFLVSGNIDPFVFQLLIKKGIGRTIAEVIIRRVMTAQLDSGTVCTLKRTAPLKELLTKIGWQSFIFFVIGLFLRRRFRVRKALTSK